MTRPKRFLLLLLLAFFALAGFGVAYYRRLLFADNLHPVVPGNVYRSAQMDARTLADTIEELKIRTVVNLRGDSTADWYAEEAATCARLGVEMIDIGFDARNEPDPWRLVRLIEVLSDPKTKRPILMHCQAGSDRAGLASAFALIVEGEDMETASGQLAVRFGHFRFTSTGVLDRLLERYARWQEARGDAPSAENLLRWAKYYYIYEKEAYKKYGAEVALEGVPAAVRRGETIRFVLRAFNGAQESWHCVPSTQEKQVDRVRVRLRIYGKGEEIENWRLLPEVSFAQVEILPGKTLRIECAIPVDVEPGHYILHADLIHNNRFSLGRYWPITARPAEIDLAVRPRAGD